MSSSTVVGEKQLIDYSDDTLTDIDDLSKTGSGPYASSKCLQISSFFFDNLNPSMSFMTTV